MIPRFAVCIERDPGDGRWTVTNSEIIGLHAEDDSLDDLFTIIERLAPELLKANHNHTGPFRLEMDIFVTVGDQP